MKHFLEMVFLVLALVHIAPTHATVLDEFVKRPDPGYGWLLYEEQSDWSARYYYLRLSSQYWLNFEQVDRTLWVHELRGVQARHLLCGRKARRSKTAILFISGSRNQPDSELKRSVSSMAAVMAGRFCRPVFELRQVPNQPLVFAGETEGRQEDALLAFSLDQYLRKSPGDWPAHLAMSKSVVRAMDAIQAFSRTRDDLPDIEDFVLMGSSKRGWAAWLAAAVDSRVRALIPVSIDMLNIKQQLPHQLRAYGDYGRALHDYKAFDIACRLGDQRGQALVNLIDPFSYRDHLKIPKLIINASGDEFFPPDAWRFYFEQLPGLKSLRYTPNTGHRQGDAVARLGLFQNAVNWVNDVLSGKQPPGLSWRLDDQRLIVTLSARARKVLLWTAENPVARDFRLETLGPAWHSRPLKPDDDGIYRVTLLAPNRGWRASLVEATFGGWRKGSQQTYTSGVYITPDTLPFVVPTCMQQP